METKMKTVLLKCPDCGESFVCEDTRSFCYCPECGKRILLIFTQAAESEKAAEPVPEPEIKEKTQEPVPEKDAKAGKKTRRSGKKTPSVSQAEVDAMKKRYRKIIALLSVIIALLFTALILALTGHKKELYIGSGILAFSVMMFFLIRYLYNENKMSETTYTVTADDNDGKATPEEDNRKKAKESIITGTTSLDDAKRILRRSGFGDVTFVPLNDLKHRLFSGYGENLNVIQRITVNGKDSVFNKGSLFDADAEFVLYYHSPKKSETMFDYGDYCDYGGSSSCDCHGDCDDDCDCDCHDDD